MRTDIKHLAKLAKLTITKEEEKELGKQFKEILGFVEKINTIKLNQKDKNTGTKNLNNVFREDTVTTDASLEFKRSVLKQAKNKDENYIITDLVVKK